MARRIAPQRARPESATPPKLTERVGIAILSVSSSHFGAVTRISLRLVSQLTHHLEVVVPWH